MKDFFKNILARSLAQKIAIIGATFIIPFLLFWQYGLSKDLKKQASLEEEIDIKTSKIVYQGKLANNLVKAKKELSELEKKLNVAVSELPDSKEIPELLSQISTLVKESGLEIELFQPTGEELMDFYAKVPVSIHMKGTFHQMLKFFEKVGNLQRIVNINAIKMYNPEIVENKMVITTECVATTFRFLSEEEREKIKEAKEAEKSKSKKRR